MTIEYKGGYRYQLKKTYAYINDMLPAVMITTQYITLYANGRLVINKGYAWDGASGPVINTKSVARASLVHDALYQLIRTGVLKKEDRSTADKIFRQICIEDGMGPIRAWYMYHALRHFAPAFLKISGSYERTLKTSP